MAQRAKIASTVKTPASGARRGRLPGSTSTKAAVTVNAVKARQPAVAKLSAIRRMPAANAPTPKVSKDELRAQAAKLEGTVATLRAKSRELIRAAKQASDRIAELETQLASAQTAVSPAPEKPARAARVARTLAGSAGRSIDPGDAVPPGVAVAEPQPLDEEARAAKDALTSHLSGE